MSILSDFFSLFFPTNCQGCNGALNGNEKILCSKCFLHLPLTNYHFSENTNSIEKIFWGRVPIEAASAYLFFTKDSIVQQLLHNLKYKGQEEVGIFLGQLYGEDLCTNEKFRNVDAIIPVPLHKSKFKKRGYNQSERIALGISNKINKPVLTNILIKATATETQTKKSRFSRWKNVQEKFTLQNTELIKEKHILLIDDVITTGATIEACAILLLSVENTKVSVAALASTI